MSLSEFQPSQMNRNGFTWIETLIAIAAIGLLIVVAVPVYHNYQERVDIEQAINDISVINIAITQYLLANNKLPADLATIELSNMRDPWGNPYQYINHKVAPSSQRRKDKNLIPLNNDYDLYSAGKDGGSAPALTAQMAQDDIVRANNGKWIGKSEKY